METPMSDITHRVTLEVVTHEGLVPEAYKDSVGVWTWSLGHNRFFVKVYRPVMLPWNGPY